MSRWKGRKQTQKECPTAATEIRRPTPTAGRIRRLSHLPQHEAAFLPTMIAQASPNRSTSACVQCRSRKVRCIAENSDTLTCRGCRRLNFVCSKVSDSRLPEEPVVQRVRTARACRACRDVKSKCTGGMPCRRCTNAAIECQYPQSKRKSRQPLPQPSPSLASRVEDTARTTDTQLPVDEERGASHDAIEVGSVTDDNL